LPDARFSFHRGCHLDPHRLKAVGGEGTEHFLGMRVVAGLDRDIELGAFRRHVEKQPAMIDFQNVGAELSEPGGDLAEDPGRSGMARRKETIRSSRSSSRTMTEARMRGSMLPPHRIGPTLRPRKRSGRASMAASPAAPAPSAIVF
jgi:hypothetical protein